MVSSNSNCFMLAALQLAIVFFCLLYYLDISPGIPIQSIGYSLVKKENESIPPSSSAIDIDQPAVNNTNTTDELKQGLSFCPLPKVDPFDQSLKGYVNYRFPETFRNCSKTFKVITKYEKGVLQVENSSSLSCKARCFSQVVYHRRNEQGPWKNITDWKIKLDCEFAEVYCAKPENLTKIEYAMLHSQLKPLKEKPKPRLTTNKVYNVYVFILDSTGATAADRNLPLTMRYLEKSMQAVTFPYINKVGQNSRPNAVALFLGKQIEPIDRTIMGKPSLKPDWGWDESCKKALDNETSIFHDFRNAGYRTLLTDDYSIGILNYPNCKGWSKPVVDHTLDPFIEETFGGPQKPNFYGSNCVFLHKEDIRFLQQFVSAYPDEPQFAMTWFAEVVHDYAEGGMMMDVDLATFLMNNRKIMDESFVIITADHGNRLSSIIWTDIGELDKNNPMLTISVPKDLRTPEILGTLKENAGKLQTHYDTRATLLDIIKHQPLSNYSDRNPLSMEGEKGNSFLRRQEGPRNCATLPIPFAYCICQFEEEKIDVNSSISVAAGKAVVDAVNERLKEGNMTELCNLWKYSQVNANTGYKPVEETGSMKITVAASWPYDKAKFSTVVHRSKEGVFSIGKVDRADKYGKRGSCAVGQFESICDCKNNTRV